MKAKLHNFKFLSKTDVVNGGKQHDIIHKFQNQEVVNRGKPNNKIVKTEMADDVNGRQQHEIKSHVSNIRCCRWRNEEEEDEGEAQQVGRRMKRKLRNTMKKRRRKRTGRTEQETRE